MYTHDEILAMSEEELNRAIAEAKGWKIENYYPAETIAQYPKLANYRTIRKADRSYTFTSPSTLGDDELWKLAKENSYFPNWTRDIGAAYQLEGEITDPMDQLAYMDFLATYSEHAETKFTRWNLIHASPKERSRAWLMWKEGRE